MAADRADRPRAPQRSQSPWSGRGGTRLRADPASAGRGRLPGQRCRRAVRLSARRAIVCRPRNRICPWADRGRLSQGARCLLRSVAAVQRGRRIRIRVGLAALDCGERETMPRAQALALVAMLTGLAGGAIVPSATAAEPEGTADTPVVVTLPQRALLRSLSVPVTSSSAAAAAPYTVARDTQSELHRVGCYDGEISGIWTPATRSAAQRFVDRVNAKLAVDKPDDVLLALLRGQTGAVCGQCQSDQTLDAAGRCVPTALINKAQRPRS